MQQLKKDLSKLHAVLTLAVVTGYFLYIVIPWLSNDLWNDEIYTLKHFTFTFFTTTVTDYHSTNNHILYNVFNHFYLKLVGIYTMQQAMEQVWMLRLPLLLLSLGTMWLLYKTGKLAGGRMAGILAVTILACAIPFQNFSLQVRGYCFSTFFNLLLVYHCLLYIQTNRRSNLLWIVVCIVATGYTMPTNLYSVIGIPAFFGVEFLTNTIKEKKTDVRNLYPVIAVVVGVALALICYSPVLKQVLANAQSATSTSLIQKLDRMANTAWTEVKTVQLSAAILFALGILVSLTLVFTHRFIVTKFQQLILWQLTVPPVLIGLSNVVYPDRTLVYVAPLVALFIAITLSAIIDSIPTLKIKHMTVSLLLACLLVSSMVERRIIKHHMDEYLTTGYRIQNLQMNYYLYNFHPLRLAEYLIKVTSTSPAPVILRSSEPHDMPDYLETFNIPQSNNDSLNYYLETNRKVYIITLFPRELDSTFIARHNCMVTEVLSSSYHHLFRIGQRQN